MLSELLRDIETVLLPSFPDGTQLLPLESYSPDGSHFLMCVRIVGPNSRTQQGILKVKRLELIEHEARALGALKCTELPVPELLFGPARIPGTDQAFVLLSQLRGASIPWCGISSLNEADMSCRLALEAIRRLHATTSRLIEQGAIALLPSFTLKQEHRSTIQEAGSWLQVDLFRRAVETITTAIEVDVTPLVFSNGDYNPLNFLVDRGEISGFVDFEGACFENPHIGFAKFAIWEPDGFGWGTGAKVGLIERYLYSRNLSRRDFAPILILRCLRHLIRETSVKKPKDEPMRRHMFGLIEKGLESLKV